MNKLQVKKEKIANNGTDACMSVDIVNGRPITRIIAKFFSRPCLMWLRT